MFRMGAVVVGLAVQIQESGCVGVGCGKPAGMQFALVPTAANRDAHLFKRTVHGGGGSVFRSGSRIKENIFLFHQHTNTNGKVECGKDAEENGKAEFPGFHGVSGRCFTNTALPGTPGGSIR